MPSSVCLSESLRTPQNVSNRYRAAEKGEGVQFCDSKVLNVVALRQEIQQVTRRAAAGVQIRCQRKVVLD